MNPLEQYIADNALDPKAAMNFLQDAGIISDLCVTPADVANADCANAVAALEANSPP